ncbi:unnamed protein product [Linum tenue]|uniref:Uncharacterized protein n=1 Tax=Linum tenue TaxID=586396 RepID=A0AAV0HC03_9ROSI|nr:unnamed protein product [Linum tenue]
MTLGFQNEVDLVFIYGGRRTNRRKMRRRPPILIRSERWLVSFLLLGHPLTYLPRFRMTHQRFFMIYILHIPFLAAAPHPEQVRALNVAAQASPLFSGTQKIWLFFPKNQKSNRHQHKFSFLQLHRQINSSAAAIRRGFRERELVEEGRGKSGAR